MSHIHKIVIGSEQFNLVEAIAPKQRELLTLLGGQLAIKQAASGVSVNDAMLVGQLLSMSDHDLGMVSDIVLWKTVLNGTDTPIDINYFQSNMCNYLLLLAGGIRANLDDFFDYLKSVSGEAQAEKSA